MPNIGTILSGIAGNVSITLQKILNLGRITAPPLLKVSGIVTLRSRKNGKIRLGRMKSRGGLRLFSDGGSITIGDDVFLNYNCSITSLKDISIGAGTLLGENVKIYDHNHSIDPTNGHISHDQFETSSVCIGSNCWIGTGVIILKGVQIPDGTTIGAGAVVTKSIPISGVYVSRGLSDLRRVS